MEDAFRFALLTLYEANQAICADARRGARRAPTTHPPPPPRDRQFTVLDVPAVLTDTAFRRRLLAATARPGDRGVVRLLLRPPRPAPADGVINPVQTKVQRFAGSRAARAIVGQPRSTVDPAGWLRDGAIVIANTAGGVVGEDTAAVAQPRGRVDGRAGLADHRAGGPAAGESMDLRLHRRDDLHLLAPVEVVVEGGEPLRDRRVAGRGQELAPERVLGQDRRHVQDRELAVGQRDRERARRPRSASRSARSSASARPAGAPAQIA